MASVSRTNTSPPTAPSPTTQQVVSLVVILHLFVVLVALTSFSRSSPLQQRLLGLFAGYTRTLNLAPAAAPYHLTQYDALTGDFTTDDEHFLELEIVRDGEVEIHNLNEQALPFPDARRRYRTFAGAMAENMADDEESQNRLAALAAAAARYGLTQYDAPSGVLRLKHHMSQPRLLANLREGFPEDPTDERYLSATFEADVLLDENGTVSLIKREPKGQVAPVIGGGS